MFRVFCTLRENRKAIEENLKSDETAKSETAVTETPEADNAALRENRAGATINSEIPEAPTEKPFTLDHTTAVHTKTKEPIEVFKIQGNLEDSEYKALKAQMKSIGGYYSSFVKGFIVPGDKVNDVSNFANVIDKTSKENPTEAPRNADIVSESDGPAEEKGDYLENSNIELAKDKDDYSINQQEAIEGYEEAVDLSLKDFINRNINGELKPNDTYSLKDVSPRASEDIKKAVGVDTTGFKTAVESRMITHILKGHGANGTTDHTMANIDDIARMQFVIDNYDNLEDGGKSSAYFEPYVSASGVVRQHTAHTVVYSKKVNGIYYVVEALPDTKRKTAFVVSAYMTNEKKKNGLSNEYADKHDIPASATSDTAEKPRAFESVPAFRSSNEIISSDNAAVNSSEEKNTSSKEQTITSQTETDDMGTKEKHRAMENGVLPTVVPEVSTSVSDAGNGVATETVASDSVVNTFYSRIADKILNEYLETGAVLDSKALVEIAREIYGGTLAEGAFSIKDATDSLELAVNRYI